MAPSHLLGLVAGLTSALVWGTGDFVGGLATRRATPFQVVTLSGLAAVCLLFPLAILTGEDVLSPQTAIWSLTAGLSGAVGVAVLYRGLSTGASAVVAPTSAVVGAAFPVLVGILTQALPGPADLAGIALGMAGIWLVSYSGAGQGESGRAGLLAGVLAGLGFGGFFVLIAQVRTGDVLTPVAYSKLAALGFGMVMLKARRQAFPAVRAHPLTLVAGLLDSGGNLFFLIATRAAGLAIAAVLASMYPSATVGCSVVWLKEHVSRRQILGVILCVSAVALISV
jgi:drug/metabolite transporter (DMT)-like permease